MALVAVTNSQLSAYKLYILALLKKVQSEVIEVESKGMIDLLTIVPKVNKHKPSQVIDFANTFKTFAAQSVYFFEENDRFDKRLLKASVIVTPFHHLKEKLLKQGIAAGNVFIVAPSANDSLRPMDWEAKDAIKEKITDGAEYFLLFANTVNEADLITLLKAFSSFKKWQKSSMKLIVYCNVTPSLTTKLEQYKYRQDLILENTSGTINYQLSTTNYIPAAYSTLSFEKNNVLNVLQAMQCGVPVITLASESITEIGGAEVLQVEKIDADAISQRMMMLYKNEGLHKQIGLNLLALSGNYLEEKAVNQLKEIVK